MDVVGIIPRMATIVFLHAHPDDEASSTSGTIALAAAEGHRVVVVFATNGEHGEVPDDLAPGETVAARRRTEAERAAAVAGTARVVWLGYSDSGMQGWEGNHNPDSFHQADLDEAAGRLARILDEEDADVLVGYDWHGNYGHPDHVKVHPVVYRAAQLARRRPRVLEVTMNRDAARAEYQRMAAQGVQSDWNPDSPGDDGNGIGLSEAELHFRVDVGRMLDLKRAALACHASQVTDIGMLLSMPDEVFARFMGVEWYREHGRPIGITDGLPF